MPARPSLARSPFRWPAVDVIVPTYNEAETIAGKLRELSEIDYPYDRVRFLVVDGGSTDGTVAIVRDHAAREPRLVPIATTLASKPAQLNRALNQSRTAWVLVTDADGRLPPDTLRRLVVVGQGDITIDVVGTTLTPEKAHPLDEWHWRLSNMVRRIERHFGTTGLVAGPCYLLRRTLVESFPTDAVADDCHVACRAAATGARVALVDADVREVRVPETAAAWYRLKTRRLLGYLREIWRFLPQASRMPYPMRAIFLWRAAALLAAPVLATVALALAPAIGGAAGVVAASAFVAPALLAMVAPASRAVPFQALFALALPVSYVLIATTAVVLYPFVRQPATFSETTLRPGEGEAG